VTEFVEGSYEPVVSWRSESRRIFSSEVPEGLKTKWQEDFIGFEVLVSVLRSVARRRLVETENPSACATVNWKVSKSAVALY
jgi:hypothetical protein